MQVSIKLQDPSDGNTPYLLEEILSTLQDCTAWHGMYAFASSSAVESVFEDKDVKSFLQTHEARLIVGIDQITNRSALENLQTIEKQNPNLFVRVFLHSNKTAIFHPKLSLFNMNDGSTIVIIGSGNFTHGGLVDNYEGYAVISCPPDGQLDVDSFNHFIENHDANLKPINNEILKLAEKNKYERKKSQPIDPGIPIAEASEVEAEEELDIDSEFFPEESRVLVAKIPRAGGRWHQVHLNRPVVDDFFRVKENSMQRAFVRHVDNTGSVISEPPRKIVFSKSNKNLKIELNARKGEDFPDDGYPIALFVESKPRVFFYTILFPGEAGYEQLNTLNNQLPSIGRGVRRVLTTVASLRETWGTCPLLTL